MDAKALSCKGFRMDGIEDGVYDVLVVDCQEVDGGVRLELAFTTGPGKGSVVPIRGSMPIDRALDLLGLPAQLVVEGGVPRVRLPR